MYKDYINISGKTIASDEKGMHEKEAHDKIAEELTLENEIEELKSAIAIFERDKSKLGTIKKNKMYRIYSYIMGIALVSFTIILCKVIFPLLGIPNLEIPTPKISFINTHSDALLFTMLPVSLLITIPYIITEPHKSRKKDRQILIIEEQLEYLYSEVAKKEKELETLRDNITKKEDIEDTEIHSLDISAYRSDLSSKLTLLECIKIYRKKLQKHLEERTLREQLTQMGVTPENIVFAEEALKRTLEKKDN